MKSVLRNSIFIFLLFLSIESQSQTPDIKFNLIAGSNGVSLGKINGMTRDIHGVMWFSDQINRCIVSYDGNRMTRYQNDPKKSNSLGGYYPECLFADSSGILWIGFYGMGLDRFDPETNSFTHYRHQPNNPGSLSNDSVTAIKVDHLGNIWIGNYGGLDLLDQKTGKFKHYRHSAQDPSTLSSNTIRAVYEDREGTLWIGSGFMWDNNKSDGGLNRFDRKTGTFTRYMNDPENPHSLIDNRVRAIFEDSKGNFWIGTGGNGLHTLYRKTGLIERHLFDPSKPDQLARPPLKSSEDHITFITEDAKENLWIGTLSNGLTRFDPATKKITHFGNNADGSGSFKDNSGWWAYSSNDGLFWVSTQESYLYKVDLFTNTIPRYDNDPGMFVHFIYEEPEIANWYATDSMGLVRKDVKTGATQRFINEPLNNKSLSNNSVRVIRKDKKGFFWLGTEGELNRFDYKTRSFTRFKNVANNNESLSNDHVFDICEDGEFLWVATLGGLNKMNFETGKFIRYLYNPEDSNSLSRDIVISILKGDTNDIWLGCWNNGGINRLNPVTGKFKHYIQGQSIGQIYKDIDGTIWAIGPGGLFLYNRKEDDFYIFGEENTSIAIQNIGSVIADDENNLWMSSSSGIYRLNKDRNQVVLFGKESGVNPEELRFSWITKMSDGKIFIPGYYGNYSFDPRKIKINSVPP